MKKGWLGLFLAVAGLGLASCGIGDRYATSTSDTVESKFMTPEQIAEDLTAALHRLGIVTYVRVADYKEAPGEPLLEFLLTPGDAEKLAAALP